MALQILRYGALALVSACLVMIALVVGGLVPLETVRSAMAKIPALVQVTTEEPTTVAEVEDTTPKSASDPAKADPGEAEVAKVEPTQSDESSSSSDDSISKTDDVSVTDDETESGKAQDESQADQKKSEEGTQTVSEDTSVPAFDVLRVEKDGSLVLAGKAAPGSTVMLRSGDGTVVGTGKAGPSGDFVILPDNPLKAGNHLLNLVVKDEGGTETVSTETATVSIPEEQNGDVLAMITKEGQASRIVAKPETLQGDDSDTASATEEDKTAETESAEVSSEGEVDKSEGESGTETAATSEKDDETSQTESLSGQQPETAVAAGESSKAEGVDVAQTDTETPQEENKTAALDPQSDDAERDQSEQNESQESDAENGSEKQASVDESTETESTAMVRVEAVEIEQGQVFVAGSATEGSTVRLYIDNKLVGETRGTSDNRFLVTRNFALDPGRHTVRADSIDNATGKVVARAEVPLLHEPVVEVAKEEPAQTEPDEAVTAKSDTEEKPEDAEVALAKPADEEQSVQEEMAKQETVESGAEPKIADARTSKAEQSEAEPKKQPETVAKADDQTKLPKEPTAEEKPSDEAEKVASTDTTEPTAKPADSASSSEQDASKKVAVADEEKPATTESSQIVTKDAVDKTEDTPSIELKPVEAEVVETPKVEPEGADVKEPVEVAAVETAEEIEGAPDGVIRTGTSVIIKKGDSLWRISRRNYGRGIRYTTIYEANRDQIKNPHRIYIGQIFKIPDRPDEELVEADG